MPAWTVLSVALGAGSVQRVVRCVVLTQGPWLSHAGLPWVAGRRWTWVGGDWSHSAMHLVTVPCSHSSRGHGVPHTPPWWVPGWLGAQDCAVSRGRMLTAHTPGPSACLNPACSDFPTWDSCGAAQKGGDPDSGLHQGPQAPMLRPHRHSLSLPGADTAGPHERPPGLGQGEADVSPPAFHQGSGPLSL